MKCEHVEADIAKIVAAEAEPVAYEDILKKRRKKMEKGIDRRGEKRYNNQAVSAAHGSAERGRGSLKTIQKQEETRTGGTGARAPGDRFERRQSIRE